MRLDHMRHRQCTRQILGTPSEDVILNYQSTTALRVRYGRCIQALHIRSAYKSSDPCTEPAVLSHKHYSCCCVSAESYQPPPLKE